MLTGHGKPWTRGVEAAVEAARHAPVGMTATRALGAGQIAAMTSNSGDAPYMCELDA